MGTKIPTHFTCDICKSSQTYAPQKREFYKCKCGQMYELVKTRYGWAQVIVRGKCRGDEESIK